MTDPTFPAAPPPRHDRGRAARVRLLLLACAGVALVAAGTVTAIAGYRSSGGPEGAVRAYFGALAAADGPRALAWSTVPAGSHPYLTSTVLAEQQRIAPLRQLTLGHVERSGNRARVRVTYRLDYSTDPVPVTQTVTVLHRSGQWRLAAGAASVQLVLGQATDRARVLSHAVPGDTVELFPGAVPISFDSPYLQLVPDSSHIELTSPGELDLAVEPTATGRHAAFAAVRTALAACVQPGAAITCPLPGLHTIPGTARGRVGTAQLVVTVENSAAGVLQVTGGVPFRGSYRELTFANRSRARSGDATIDVSARAYAVAPLRVRWDNS